MVGGGAEASNEEGAVFCLGPYLSRPDQIVDYGQFEGGQAGWEYQIKT